MYVAGLALATNIGFCGSTFLLEARQPFAHSMGVLTNWLELAASVFVAVFAILLMLVVVIGEVVQKQSYRTIVLRLAGSISALVWLLPLSVTWSAMNVLSGITRQRFRLTWGQPPEWVGTYLGPLSDALGNRVVLLSLTGMAMYCIYVTWQRAAVILLCAMPGRCHNCGYAVGTAKASVCPECGAEQGEGHKRRSS